MAQILDMIKFTNDVICGSFQSASCRAVSTPFSIMTARPATKFASASPSGSPYTSPTKLKPTPPKMLTIQDLGVGSTNFQVRVLVDNIGEPRPFSNGQGFILRIQLSDADGLIYGFVASPSLIHVFVASITGVAFGMVAKYVAKSLEVGKVRSFSSFQILVVSSSIPDIPPLQVHSQASVWRWAWR